MDYQLNLFGWNNAACRITLFSPHMENCRNCLGSYNISLKAFAIPSGEFLEGLIFRFRTEHYFQTFPTSQLFFSPSLKYFCRKNISLFVAYRQPQDRNTQVRVCTRVYIFIWLYENLFMYAYIHTRVLSLAVSGCIDVHTPGCPSYFPSMLIWAKERQET